MTWRLAVSAGLLLASCVAPNIEHREEVSSIPEIVVDGYELDARALVADLAFHMPEETEQLVRGLQRSAFAEREAHRLGIHADDASVQLSLQAALHEISANLPEGADMEHWARSRYERSLAEVRAALESRIRRNLVYQLVLRCESLLSDRLRMHVFHVAAEDEGFALKRKLEAGADPRVLLQDEFLPPWVGEDGTWPPLPVFLPEPLGSALENAAVGTVVGPLRLPGDEAYWVVRVAEVLPATVYFPPQSVLLEALHEQPILPIEARAWFEEMASRYTSSGKLPNIRERKPFVPHR